MRHRISNQLALDLEGGGKRLPSEAAPEELLQALATAGVVCRCEGIGFLRGLVGLDIIAVDVNTVSPPQMCRI